MVAAPLQLGPNRSLRPDSITSAQTELGEGGRTAARTDVSPFYVHMRTAATYVSTLMMEAGL